MEDLLAPSDSWVLGDGEASCRGWRTLAECGARVWRLSEVPTQKQGITVLGLVGHRDFIRKHFEKFLDKHQKYIVGIPRVPVISVVAFPSMRISAGQLPVAGHVT